MTTTAQTHTCPRCSGTGRITAFRTVAQGTCFLCGGTGTRPGQARKPRAPKAQATGQNEAVWAEFAAKHPAAAARILAGVAADMQVAHVAYSQVYVYDRRDANFAAAVQMSERIAI